MPKQPQLSEYVLQGVKLDLCKQATGFYARYPQYAGMHTPAVTELARLRRVVRTKGGLHGRRGEYVLIVRFPIDGDGYRTIFSHRTNSHVLVKESDLEVLARI